jgi:antitoxin HicB
MFDYPVTLEPDDGTILVTFPDFPEAATFGDDEADALARAVDALETILIAYVGDRRDIPQPSPAEGRPTVAPGLLASLKLAIYVAMRARGWRKADLARAMGVDPRQADRLLDLRYASTVAQLEQALLIARGPFVLDMHDAADARPLEVHA